MGTTFVDIENRGFWMHDSLLELWLRLLALHLDDPSPAETSPVPGIRDQWLLASRGYFNGCVPHGLEDALATREGNTAVRDAIQSLMRALSAAPDHISKDALNLLGFSGGPFEADIETRRLREIGQAFLDLLDGKIQSGPADTSFMPGSTALR
jgi:hypothetical protein